MQLLYSAKGCGSADPFSTWTEVSRREFFDGDLEASPKALATFIMEKAINYPIVLTRLISAEPLSFRRTSQHIRNNKVGFRILWFVRHGMVKIVRAQGVSVVRAGEFCFLDSTSPFFSTLQGEGNVPHLSYPIVVPPDLFLTHLEEMDKLTDAYSLGGREGTVVQQLLDLVIANGEHLSRQAIKPLVQSLLESIADQIRSLNIDMPRRQGLLGRRLVDIENYVLKHLADPDLCHEKVASGCGISPRYLCHVLKVHNTSFSELLWKNRLPRARNRLIAPGASDQTVHEIAYMSGFKSTTHFTRMFKATYGLPPRRYRTAYGQSAQ